MLNRCGWMIYSGGKGTLLWGNIIFLVINDDLWGRGPQCMWTNPSNPGNMQGDFLFTDQNSRVWKKVQISELAPPQKCQMEKKILTPLKFDLFCEVILLELCQWKNIHPLLNQVRIKNIVELLENFQLRSGLVWFVTTGCDPKTALKNMQSFYRTQRMRIFWTYNF